MKTRNKVLIGSGVLCLFLVIAGYSVVSAYGPWMNACGGFHPRMHSRGFHSGAHHQDMTDFVLWKMDKKAKELNLSASQKAKYEVIKSNVKNQMVTFQADHQKMRDQFHKEIEKENPDVKWILETAKTRLNGFSGFMNSNLDLLMDFYATLDSRQKAMINDEIKERMKYHRS